ncbi:MAG TPA: hypothetical protein VGD04_04665 [Methylophilus sp.]
MNIWQKVSCLGLALFALQGVAGEIKTAPMTTEPAITELPTDEKAFVAAIGKLNKAKIVELLGEPAKADDVKLKDSGRVVASIWHYHYINTSAENGEYYQTTELDFIDDKVNVVVFLNNDGTEIQNPGQKYEVPDVKPEM